MKALLFIVLLLTSNPSHGNSQPPSYTARVTATAYCLKGKMTNGERTHHGCIALSRDLAKALGLKKGKGTYDYRFGAIIELKGVGKFVFKDLMPPQWRLRVDVWQPSVKHCHVFGVKRCDLRLVKR